MKFLKISLKKKTIVFSFLYLFAMGNPLLCRKVNPNRRRALSYQDNIVSSVLIKKKLSSDFDYLSRILHRKSKKSNVERHYLLGKNLEKKSGIYAIVILKRPSVNYFSKANLEFSCIKYGELNVSTEIFEITPQNIEDQYQIFLKIAEKETEDKIAAWRVRIIDVKTGEILGKKESLFWHAMMKDESH